MIGDGSDGGIQAQEERKKWKVDGELAVGRVRMDRWLVGEGSDPTKS